VVAGSGYVTPQKITPRRKFMTIDKQREALRQRVTPLTWLPEGTGPGQISPQQFIGITSVLGDIATADAERLHEIDEYVEQVCQGIFSPSSFRAVSR
jgi:hypothetical protein